MKDNKILYIGNYNTGNEAIGGQTIKTRIIYKEIVNNLSTKNVKMLDTEMIRKSPAKFFYILNKEIRKSNHVIVSPAHNGVKILIPLLTLYKRVFGFKLHYIVVGAWIADILVNNKFLLRSVKKIDFIYCETNTLINKLTKLNVQNLILFPNFKDMNTEYINIESICNSTIPFCFVSRINEKKGVLELINSFEKLYNLFKLPLTLDFYGPIDKNFEDAFLKKIGERPRLFKYKGVIPHDKVNKVISNYYLLLFPTKYYTEGIPGVILDAFYASVPTLASSWESAHDVIDNNHNGVIFKFGDMNDFEEKLIYLVENPSKVVNMKDNCRLESEKYNKSNIVKILMNNLK